jgi:hypothetical protein
VVDGRPWQRPAVAAWPRSRCSIHRGPLRCNGSTPAAADPLLHRLSRVDRGPRQGGVAAPSAWGSPRPNAPHFPGCWGSMGARAAVDPVVAGLVSRTASPHSAPGTARLAGGASRLRCAPSGFTRRGRGMCLWGGEQPWRPGIRVGLGSTVAMGALERSSDQLPNGPVVEAVSGGRFICACIGTRRQPSPRLGCETRSGCKRAV